MRPSSKVIWPSLFVACLTLATSNVTEAALYPRVDVDEERARPSADKDDAEEGPASDEPEAAEPSVALEASPPLTAERRLSSPYGWRRSLRTGRRTFHAGVDFRAPRGTPVFSVRPGTVVRVARDEERWNGMRGYGNAVVVYHKDEDVWTLYAHLDEVRVKPGVSVAAGQVVGTVGNTSNGLFRRMGVHLHLEVRERDRRGRCPIPGRYRVNNIDPSTWLADHGLVYDSRGQLVPPTPSTDALAAASPSGAARRPR